MKDIILSKNILHNAKLALELYSSVSWAIKSSFDDIYNFAKEVGGGSIEKANLIFEIFLPEKDKEDVLESINKTEYTNLILNSIIGAVSQVKDYPKYGEDYYTILNDLYIKKNSLSGEKIAEKLNISKTTFYKRKREAIRLFSICLFGYQIPEFKGYIW